MRPLLVIRTDADADIGLGHAMRCIALAQAWRERGGDVRFVVVRGSDVLSDLVQREDLVITRLDVARGSDRDARETMQIATALRARVVVIDGYCFGTDYQHCLKQSAIPCVMIDDHARLPEYVVDVVVDANVDANAEDYRARTRARVLTGLDYAMLRTEFRLERARPRTEDGSILVTFGGADHLRLTERVVSILAREQTLRLAVLIGRANQRRAEIEKLEGDNVKVLFDPPNVARYMGNTTVAISAAGSTCAELACLGVPAFVVPVADNQRLVATGFACLGSARVFDEHTLASVLPAISQLLDDPTARSTMSACGRRAVDGAGAGRVSDALLELAA